MSSATELSGPARAPKTAALLALCRVSNLPTVWMNVVTAAVLVGGAAPGAVLLLCVALSAFYCAGMALNDVCDREHDARAQPFRPIPSGRVSLGEARAATAALFALGFALLALAPHPAALGSGLALAALIAAYDLWHKRHPATVALMAGCRALVFVVTAHALAGRVPGLVLAAAALQFAYTLLVTAIARYEGRRGRPFAAPVIPRLLAAMPLLDGLVLAVAAHPAWLLLGAALAALTRLAQRRLVRGD